jgi:hypothetical protein
MTGLGRDYRIRTTFSNERLKKINAANFLLTRLYLLQRRINDASCNKLTLPLNLGGRNERTPK